METYACNAANDYFEDNDYVPATPEAQSYAAPLQRAPKNRTAFTPEGIQAARDARANRGKPAAGGSGAGPTPANAPRRGPADTAPHPPPPPAGTNSRKTSTARAIDLMAHLDSTPMKISLGTFVEEAPDCRVDLIKHLQSFKRDSSQCCRSPKSCNKKSSIRAC